MIRVVGLSATLPNYHDVAAFLNVNPSTGGHLASAWSKPKYHIFSTLLKNACCTFSPQASLATLSALECIAHKEEYSNEFLQCKSSLFTVSCVYSFLSLSGLFYFDSSFRPVPLALDFVGVTVNNFAARNSMMTEICYNKVR
mgnify:CR=1 FL=1